MKLHIPLSLRFILSLAILSASTVSGITLPSVINDGQSHEETLTANTVIDNSPFTLAGQSSLQLTGNGYDLTVQNTASGSNFYVKEDSSLELSNMGNIIFTENSTKYSGGAFRIERGTLSITGNGNITFSDNSVAIGKGGAIYLILGSTQELTGNGNIVFSQNYVSNDGGAIYLHSDSLNARTTQTISRNGHLEFSGNHTGTDGFGGAIHLALSRQDITDNASLTFSGNTGAGVGGAICIIDSSIQFILNNGNITFSDNTAGTIDSVQGFGGAIVGFINTEQTIAGNDTVSFQRNVAKNSGGAIYLAFNSTHTLQQNGQLVFSRNSAGVGGAIALDDASLTIADNASVIFRGNYSFALDPASSIDPDTQPRLNAIVGTVTLDANAQPEPILNLSAPDHGTITFHDPIVLQAANNNGLTTTDAVLLNLNGITSTGGTSEATGSGTIVLTGENAEQDLHAAWQREQDRRSDAGLAPLPTPDEAAWQTMLEDSRTTSIKGAAVLHGGTFAITNGAAYRGEDFTTMPGSMLHLRNNASMNVRNAIFSSGSRLEISGSAPSRISADNLTAGGTTFGFRLSGPSGTPMLSITANTFTFGNNAFVLSPDQGITHLADGSYTLLHFTGQDNLHTLFSSSTLRFEGIEAETSEFSWNEEGTELMWKGSGIIVTEFRPEPPSPGDPDHPATPALSDAATMAAAVSINTLWTTTRSLQRFTDSLRTHSVQLSTGQEGRGKIWFDTIGSFLSQNGERGLPGYDFSSWGAALGGEYDMTPYLTLGAGIGSLYGKNKADGGISSIDQALTMGGLYANIRLMEHKNDTLWLSAATAFGHSRNNGHASARDGSSTLAAKWNENAWTGDLRTTWIHALNESTALHCFAGVRYTAANRNAFTASNGNAENDRFGKADLTTIQLPVGAGLSHLSGKWSFYGEMSVLPDAGRNNPHASLVDSHGNRYTVDGINPGRCAVELQAAAAYALTPNWQLTAGYQMETTGDTTQQRVTLGTAYSF